jgi:hypothetical protein
MHLFTKVMGPLKEEMMIITMDHFTIPPKVIPAYEYHVYTISTFSQSNPPTLPPPQKKHKKTNKTGICIGHHS